MLCDWSKDRPGLNLTIREDRKMRRLAILLAAQLPDNPDHAYAALSYAMEHARACGANAPAPCPRKATCADYHAAVTSHEHAAHCRANEA